MFWGRTWGVRVGRGLRPGRRRLTCGLVSSGQALGAGGLEWSSGRTECGHPEILYLGRSLSPEEERKEKLRGYSLDVEQIRRASLENPPHGQRRWGNGVSCCFSAGKWKVCKQEKQDAMGGGVFLAVSEFFTW